MGFVLVACLVYVGYRLFFPHGGVARTELYASPLGEGGACTLEAPCSLTDARDKARGLDKRVKRDIIVNLREGTYELDSPFVLIPEDSGSAHARVVYQPYGQESVLISGGRHIGGWQLYDRARNIYVAKVDPAWQSRQLFVNGTRAVRARSEENPEGFAKTAQGYRTTSPLYANLGSWAYPKDLEFVGMTNWRSYRCGVQSIQRTDVRLNSLCWTKTQHSEEMNEPAWFENAYELLDQEGEWYGDWHKGNVYYKPRAGENIQDAEAVLPVLDALIVGAGKPDQPVSHLTIRGLSFAYGTWHLPIADVGYVPMQAGFAYMDPQDRDAVISTPAQLTFQWASDVTLERNQFVHMGSAAVSFDRGSQRNQVIGNRFEDLSSHAIQIGNVADSRVSGAAIVQDNQVRNNYISLIGQEYFDAVGIFVGYASGTVIDHNEIANVPYTGISVGWGWTDKAYASLTHNRITNNRIHDYMLTLNDGGGIYTLSRQDNSEISGNYLYNNHHDYGSIYLDLGSQGFKITSNVISDPKRVTNWIFIQDSVPPYSTNNTVSGNFTDTSKVRIYPHNFTSDNLLVRASSWPDAAATIMRNSGLQKAFQDIKS
ncbi:right-handed parallel beta-helix repeat-containing protein [Paenibacillus whitsoniae]|uniref:Right-handed parallel beta-helix repeat-containing protein n=1 Tax=Paenibacillus whitsoniae TaxID=2496558 RepID=A0A3S0A2L3_9BACL|nr:right-handed parallel beta-helix repeat-containing protein [Paenibacillus whitsoniae]